MLSLSLYVSLLETPEKPCDTKVLGWVEFKQDKLNCSDDIRVSVAPLGEW